MTRPLRNPLFAQLATDAWQPARTATETIIGELDQLVDRVLRNPPVLALYICDGEYGIVDYANGYRRMILPTTRPAAVGWALRFKLDCPEARLHGSLLGSEGEPTAGGDDAACRASSASVTDVPQTGLVAESASPSDSFSVRVPEPELADVIPIDRKVTA